jgi:hypothetical protein
VQADDTSRDYTSMGDQVSFDVNKKETPCSHIS